MDEIHNIIVANRVLGSFRAGDLRTVTVSDKKISFKTPLQGTWPDDWLKKDITIKPDYWSLVYRVKFTNNEVEEKKILSVYTRRDSYTVYLPITFIACLSIPTITHVTVRLTAYFAAIALLYTYQYIKFRKLGNALRRHKFL